MRHKAQLSITLLVEVEFESERDMQDEWDYEELCREAESVARDGEYTVLDVEGIDCLDVREGE